MQRPSIKPSARLVLTNALVMANPVLAHMRKVVYTPTFINHQNSETTKRELMIAADEKRQRKMDRNKKLAQK